MRGSSIDEKCEMMDVVGIVSVFMLSGYHKMMYKALFYNDNCYIREDKFRLRNTHSVLTKFNLLLSKQPFLQPMAAHDFNAIALHKESKMAQNCVECFSPGNMHQEGGGRDDCINPGHFFKHFCLTVSLSAALIRALACQHQTPHNHCLATPRNH
ncbi:MAG: hypothetical protein AUJ57_07370 [Zetaproteobacteria bacterium CG1_02_53_45]|nr:MAG: hypothetical protein AUJ57_07370 [Zetaproteobacteria bacterium CG1_02_53_45]